MNDDIVKRLRLRPTILRKNQFGDMETDRAATALFDDCHAIMRDAADEIERLRRNTGCARNQRSTQFCAEALDAQREIERLREERDEARRAIITLLAGTDIRNMHRLADERGWDCFKDKAACCSTPADGEHTFAGENKVCGLCDQPSDAVNGHGDCMNCAKDQYGA